MIAHLRGSIAELQAALHAGPDRRVGAEDPGPADAAWGAGPVALPAGDADLIRCRPTSRGTVASRPAAEVDAVAAAISGGHRRARVASTRQPVVAVFAITGGAGVSSLAAALADRWVASGRRVVVLDASGAAPGLAAAGPERAAGCWPALHDAAGLAAAVTGRLRAGPVAVIDGPSVPHPAQLAAAIGAAGPAAATVIDLPARHDWVAAALPTLAVDLAVMCCPARPVVLRAAADFLRRSAGPGWPRTVWAITGHAGRRGRAAIAAGSDVTAGAVRLSGRTGRRGVGTILAAADAAAGNDEEETA